MGQFDALADMINKRPNLSTTLETLQNPRLVIQIIILVQEDGMSRHNNQVVYIRHNRRSPTINLCDPLDLSAKRRVDERDILFAEQWRGATEREKGDETEKGKEAESHVARELGLAEVLVRGAWIAIVGRGRVVEWEGDCRRGFLAGEHRVRVLLKEWLG